MQVDRDGRVSCSALLKKADGANFKGRQSLVRRIYRVLAFDARKDRGRSLLSLRFVALVLGGVEGALGFVTAASLIVSGDYSPSKSAVNGWEQW